MYPTLSELFQKYNYDISKITFQNPNKKFCCPIEYLEISDWGSLGYGVNPKKLECFCQGCEIASVGFCHRYSSEYPKSIELTYPDVLNIEVNIDSFYIDSKPEDFKTSPKLNEEQITKLYYNEIIKENKQY